MDQEFSDLVKQPCTCGQCENRIVLEVVNLCPDCMYFMSTAMYEVPGDKIDAVLEKFDQVMTEIGVKRKGMMKVGPVAPVTVHRHSQAR